MKIYTYFTLFILLLSVTIANSTILRVPNQYRTIEIAIEFAEDGDTVLVGRGTYDGPINFAGKNIVIASNYIISYQQQDINQTILQGSGNGRSVVVIRNGEAEGTELNGFTVRNGDTDYGGGIYISGSSANLRNLVVLENNAQVLGGGVYITNNADVVIENSLISSNVGYFHGGGISVRNASDVKLKNTKFLANRVDRTGSGTGGGIQAYGACIVEIDSCVFISS